MGQRVDIIEIGDTDIIARFRVRLSDSYVLLFLLPQFLVLTDMSAFLQGRLSLSTDGDKCAMVNFLGGNEKSILGGMKKFNIKSMNFVHKFNN